MHAISTLHWFLIMLTVNCLTNKVFFPFFVFYMHQKRTLSIAVVSEKVMAWVDKCPQNLTGVNEASRKLGCDLDQYGNNRYLCLPNVEKTSLVEFCFNGTMGYFEKGHCLQTSGGNLTLESCLKFSTGCPEYEFKSTDFYNYAACHDLNLKYNCYTFDLHCPPQSIENTNYGAIVASLIVGLIVLIIISLSSYFLWKRLNKGKGGKAREKQDEENQDEEEAFFDSISPINDEIYYVWVAAIDFGTTFSSYAFGCRDDLKENPTSAFWLTAGGGLMSFKIPTTVLLDKNEELVNFGFAAETTYTKLAENNEHDDYFYFRRFKMMLFDKVRTSKLTTDTTISDIRGRKVKALKVFTHAIRYLREHSFTSLKSQKSHAKKDEILWVLTVPSIWDDAAKLFMRKAAKQAGIPENQLRIALEAEAASIYCQYIPIWKKERSNSISVCQPGSKYLVLDAGGGIIDITVHEVKSNGTLKELHYANGGDWGGTNVDTAFEKALAEIVTENMIKDYSDKYTGHYIDWLRKFESKKCKLKIDKPGITLKVPVSFLRECSETLGTDLTNLTNNIRFKDHFVWKSDKLRIDMPTLGSFFHPICNVIVNHIEKLLMSPEVKDVKKILMVGGFSESHFLQDAIRKAFPDCQVIVPFEPSLAVLRGAVLFGHKPEIIESRIAKYTYGVRINEEFDPKKHTYGVDDSKEVFVRLVQKGDELVNDKAEPLTLKQGQVSIPICILNEVDTHCIDKYEDIGKYTITMPVNEKDRYNSVEIVFGKTEITVKRGNDTPGVFELPEDEKEQLTK